MHEAGIAARIAESLRSAGIATAGPPICLRVSGGHDDPEAFDAALRLHLLAAIPGLDPSRLAIVHEPHAALCVVCGTAFEGEPPEPVCPSCGTPGLLEPTPESVAIEVGEAASLRATGTVSATPTERPT